ncbi:hypothetical protein OIU80_05980 [Flavobacterium sp. LS1R47]|uniref:YD repeat-containing protein n=1 Tax=Flavobacterium frigoritolerans TaxID=2987686 RepID=A0A9X3C7N0_9FLAO|nr:hypothetical protein [Flavobacterium frigoritolerans]MCV9931827.1 hypothetical protein [Flavobacterium frigoritolerans]
MKKILCLFSAMSLVLASCSSNDDNESSPILLQKIVYIGDDGTSSTSDITYDGNKIISIKAQDGSVYKYIYTGNLITKIEEIDEDGALDITTEYSYTNGKLVACIEKQTDAITFYKTKYTHNADATVSYEEFRINAVTGLETEGGTIGKFTFNNGNLVKDEKSYYGSERVITYEYDTKNDPLRNVLNHNLLLDEDSNINNLIKETSTYKSGDNTYINTTTYTYKYDVNNYPTEKVVTYQAGTSTFTETSQFFY